mgnify:CR=1 FL=1
MPVRENVWEEGGRCTLRRTFTCPRALARPCTVCLLRSFILYAPFSVNVLIRHTFSFLFSQGDKGDNSAMNGMQLSCCRTNSGAAV